jgi:hypothetical protein
MPQSIDYSTIQIHGAHPRSRRAVLKHPHTQVSTAGFIPEGGAGRRATNAFIFTSRPPAPAGSTWSNGSSAT